MAEDEGVVCDRSRLGPASIMLALLLRLGVEVLSGLGPGGEVAFKGVSWFPLASRSTDSDDPPIAMPIEATGGDDDDEGDSLIKRFASWLDDRRVGAGEGKGDVAREDSCEMGLTGRSGKGSTFGCGSEDLERECEGE